MRRYMSINIYCLAQIDPQESLYEPNVGMPLMSLCRLLTIVRRACHTSPQSETVFMQ
jgi:hypothetical protein